MALIISIPKSRDDLPVDPLLILTRTALGLGVGLLVADRIKRPARQATAMALMSIGTLAAVPFLVRVALGRFNRGGGAEIVCAVFGAIRDITPTPTRSKAATSALELTSVAD